MDLPIKFPSEADVIVEETNRFRALSPLARIDSLRGLIATGMALIKLSPHSAYLREYEREQETAFQQNLRAFYDRHAGNG